MIYRIRDATAPWISGSGIDPTISIKSSFRSDITAARVRWIGLLTCRSALK